MRRTFRAAVAAAAAVILPATAFAFDRNVVQRGAELAAIGNCTGCHTKENGRPYAGGVALETPFGTIFSTNITPDPDTGIGKWSQEAFDRAMREGIAADGHHLYPVFPYDHFRHLTQPDLQALYAYVMTRDPVRAEAPENRVRFPFNIRALISIWNLLFLDAPASTVIADASKSEPWNRGAYLAEGLGHCGACHTPRNALGAEKKESPFAGGEAEGWYVPALNQQSPSPLPWTLEELRIYLRTGLVEGHAIAGGPMQGVVYELSKAAEEDILAIATYVHALLGGATPEREARAKASLERASRPLVAADAKDPGASIYAGACASCHDAGRQLSSSSALQLPLAVALYDPDPASLIRIIRDGIIPPQGERGRWMPGYAGALTDGQIAALVSYLRGTTGEPAWPDVSGAVRKARGP